MNVDQSIAALLLVLFAGACLFAACASRSIERGLVFIGCFIGCLGAAFYVMGRLS